jgi:hypothetical protein
MNKVEKEPGNKDIKQSLKFFGVEDEDELDSVIENDWNKARCTLCGRVIDLTTCRWDDGDPCCYHGCCHG